MPTRNKNRKKSDIPSCSSSYIHGVDFRPSQPIVALPAVNHPNLLGKAVDDAANSIPTEVPPNSSSNLVGSSSSARAPATPAPVAAATVTPVRTESSNPVLRDICSLKSGELTVVPEKVAKHFGFPAGPVANLDFSDPKVAEFFNVPVQRPAPIVQAVAAPVLVNPLVNSVQDKSVQAVSTVVSPIGISNIVANSVVEPPTLNDNSVVNSNVVVEQIGDGSRVGSVGVVKEVGRVPVVPTVLPPMANAVPNPAPTQNLNSTKQPSPPGASWAGLFKNNRVLDDDTKMYPCYVGVTTEKVVLQDCDLDDDDEEKRSLIGFFNGKFPGIKAIQHIVDGWSRKCTFHQHNSGWLVFTFDEEADCEIVMKEGPYYAFSKPLVLKKMPEFFDFGDDAYSTAPVWIQLPNLPLRAWKKEALQKICSFLGTPLHVDQVTKTKSEKSFARCLVEMDVSKELPTLVCCDLPRGKFLRQHVLYEETPTFCANCKKLGHETDDCYASNNGVPSLYVTRNKKEKEKKKVPISGSTKVNKSHIGHAQGSAKAGNGHASVPVPVSGSGPAAGADSEQGAGLSAAATLAANSMVSGTVSRPNVAAVGNLGSRMVTRQSAPTTNATGNKNIGKTIDANAKDSGFVSANSFGPLANEMMGPRVDDAEASNARNNKNKKGNNGAKK